jgi:hypothetical protein
MIEFPQHKMKMRAPATLAITDQRRRLSARQLASAK